MKIHVICAFYRKYLLPTHIRYLEPMNIEWVVACDEVDIQAFENNDRAWIHPVLCPPLVIPGDQVYKKFNACLDQMEINDDDYYCFMGDDDMYEQGFFDVIRRQTAKIIVFSSVRGNALPPNLPGPAQHHPSPLIINSLSNIYCGNINLQQYVLKGEILKQVRFNNTSPADDGYLAEKLVKNFGWQIEIIPDLFAFGNYFQPGRYTNDDWKIKPHWELPVFYEE